MCSSEGRLKLKYALSLGQETDGAFGGILRWIPDAARGTDAAAPVEDDEEFVCGRSQEELR